MADKEIRFPDLNEAFEGASSLEQVSKNYEMLLREQGDIDCVLYANKLQQFRKMTQITKLRELEKEFHELKEHVREIAKEHGISITVERRRKDFLGLNEKIRRNLKYGISLEKVQDLLGFRLIILSGEIDNECSIKLCYEVLNRIIQYFVTERSCLLTEAEPVIDTEFQRENFPNIVIPERSYISPFFMENVKDYIRVPKKNSYQSLHTVFRKIDGFIFEVQVRSLAMDINAQYGVAAHDPYKEKKYENVNIVLDFSKVHLPGFAILEDGTIVDKIGLIHSVDPFNVLTIE